MARSRRRAGRIAALSVLWNVLRGSRQPGGRSVGQRLAAFPRLVGSVLRGRYDGMGLGRLVAFAMATAYVVSPVDLMPELLLPVVGAVDDLGVLAWLVGSLLGETDRFLDWEGETRLSFDDAVPGQVVR
jgi:uncharacterized membrane protein YkvA (DUF1232 family)